MKLNQGTITSMKVLLQGKQCRSKTHSGTQRQKKSFIYEKKTLRYRQQVRFITNKRSERFNDPKKPTYKDF